MIQTLSKQKIRIAQIFLSIFFITTILIPVQQASANLFSDEVFDIPNTALSGVNTGSTVVSTGTIVKDFVVKLLAQVLKAIAQVLLKKLTEATVNWINGGFKGAPQFVSNPKSFFKNIGDTQLENLIDTVGYNASKYPYGREISQALISSYRNKNSDIGQTMKYTLTGIVGQEANKFQKNFNVGGWAGYEAYSQNPANNAFGSLFLASDKAAKVVNDTKQAVQKEIDLGQGFLNQKSCTKWKTPPQTGTVELSGPPGAKTDANCTEWKTLSPGSVVQGQLNQALGSKFMESQLGAALGNSISSIINALTTSLLNKGLEALSSIGKDDSSQKADNWSYDGQTLGAPSSQTSSNPDNWSQAPDKVIDLNQLLLVGTDFDVDEYGHPIKQTMIQLAERQVSAYKAILDLVHGTSNQKSFAAIIRELDYTIPGPKFGWETRFNRKFSKIVQKWSVKEGKGTKKKQQKTDEIVSLLLDRQDAIPSSLRIKALSETIPAYTDVQAQIKDAFRYSGKEKEFTDKYIDSITILNRLKNIKVKLNEIIANYTDPAAVTSQNDPGLAAYLAAQGQPDITPNPLLSLTGEGQKQLQLLIKEYSLLAGDAPNSYTVQDAENSLIKIKFEYDNILKTIAQVRTEVTIAKPDHIYRVQVKDRFIKSVTHIEASSLSQDKLDTIYSSGYYDPEAKAAAALQGLNIAGSVITTILTFGMSAPLSATQGAVTGVMIANRDHDVYINSFGGGAIPEPCELSDPACDPNTNPNANPVGDPTGLELVHIVTDKTVAEMRTTLNDDYGAGSLDEDHKYIYDSLSDEKLSLLYSIIVSTNELQLTDDWDNAATGQARLNQTLDFMDEYDATEPSYKPNKTDGERMFFCQSEVDRLDTTEGKGAFKSLFRRAKFDCSDFYDSNVIDYRLAN